MRYGVFKVKGPLTLLMEMEEEEERKRKEEERRKREEERKRKEEEERLRKQEEERQREEKRRKMIEHRKNSPVICNEEEWQINRCVKAISLQSSIKDLISTIEKERPTVIEKEEKKYNDRIFDVGYEYELARNNIDKDIETLEELGVFIKGTQYELSRLAHVDANIAKIEQTIEHFGNIFTINNNQPIELNSDILSNQKYFEERFEQTNPEEIERESIVLDAKINKYHRVGKFLGFLLKTKGYLKLEDQSKSLSKRKQESILRKKELQSFQSLNKDQLLAIKLYFSHLDELSKISDKLKSLFNEKDDLKNNDNKYIYDLTIKSIMYDSRYNELVSEVYDYISRIYSNDEETMKQAYELVKGEYPIEISERFLYDLIITNVGNYNRESIKEFRLK